MIETRQLSQGKMKNSVLLILGISDVNNLLSRKFLRIAVWLIAVFTIIGNVQVILRRILTKTNEENTKPVYTIFIGNLAGN